MLAIDQIVTVYQKFLPEEQLVLSGLGLLHCRQTNSLLKYMGLHRIYMAIFRFNTHMQTNLVKPSVLSYGEIKTQLGQYKHQHGHQIKIQVKVISMDNKRQHTYPCLTKSSINEKFFSILDLQLHIRIRIHITGLIR